jgi:diguanylate cyclase (GGDEF)-like protein
LTILQGITDSAYEAILLMDGEGNISFWNPVAERLLGYTQQETMGRKFLFKAEGSESNGSRMRFTGGEKIMEKNHFNGTRFIIAIAVLLVVVLTVSLSSEIKLIKEQYQKLALSTAESYLKTIVLVRKWNALHDGVYVPVTADTLPNPYLDDPLRDLETTNGMELTKINPAFMTRLIAEIANKEKNPQFHMTSLNPINPGNKPDPWEEEALRAFETGEEVKHGVFQAEGDRDSYFRYMAPLKVEQSCLQCHAKQGYKVGDIRGGLTVTLPYKPFQVAQTASVQEIILTHLVFLAAVASTMLFFGRNLVSKERELRLLSVTDTLTKVYNRRYFIQKIEEELERAKRAGSKFSLIMLDIDHFKSINDRYGHHAGDLVLKSMVDMIKNRIRKIDTLARWGGEEFVILLPETAANKAAVVAEELRQHLSQMDIPGVDRVTVSFGVAGYCPGDTVDTLVNKADNMMYEAKAAGRNCVRSEGGV